MKKYYKIFILITYQLLFCNSVKSQEIKEIQNIDVFYIDDSEGFSRANIYGLTDTLLSLLQSKIEEIEKSNNSFIWVFQSNSNNPSISKNDNTYRNIINLLPEQNTEKPDFALDKKLLRDLFYNDTIKITQCIHFHYFITGNFYKSLIDNYSNFPMLLPKELYAMGIVEKNANTMITFYTSALNEFQTSLNMVLGFYNKEQYKLSAEIQIIKI